MTEIALQAAAPVESDIRLGRVFSRTGSVLSRHFLPFFLVNVVATVPTVLGSDVLTPAMRGGPKVALLLLGMVLAVVISTLAQAVVFHGVFQALRDRRVSLMASVHVALHRLIPLIGLALSILALAMAGAALLIVPGLIVLTMLAVATPACMAEELGPFRSMERSARLTKGNRWKIFAAIVVLVFPAAVMSGVIEHTLPAMAGTVSTFVCDLICNAVASTVTTVFVSVLYRDLRVARDGVDTDRIASVFE